MQLDITLYHYYTSIFLFVYNVSEKHWYKQKITTTTTTKTVMVQNMIHCNAVFLRCCSRPHFPFWQYAASLWLCDFSLKTNMSYKKYFPLIITQYWWDQEETNTTPCGHEYMYAYSSVPYQHISFFFFDLTSERFNAFYLLSYE